MFTKNDMHPIQIADICLVDSVKCIGSAPLTDLYFFLVLNVKTKCWIDLVRAIRFAARFGSRMQISKVDFVICYMLYGIDI